MHKKYLLPFIAGTLIALFHGYVSVVIMYEGITEYFYNPKENADLVYGIPYALWNLPTLFTKIPGTTPILLFGIVFGIGALIVHRKKSLPLPFRTTMLLWLFFITTIIVPIFMVWKVTYFIVSPVFCETVVEERMAECLEELAVSKKNAQ